MDGTYRVGANIGKDEVFRLNQVIDHPSLFDNYPELKNTMVLFDKRGGGASFDPYMNEIHLPRKGVMLGQQNSYLDSISHEIQHWIQQKEDFARGGSPDLGVTPEVQKILDKMKKPLVEELRRAKEAGDWARADDLQKKIMMDLPQEASFKAYQNLAGEIEARDVSGRRTWDADFSPNGRLLIAAGGSRAVNVQTVRIWKIDTGSFLRIQNVTENKEIKVLDITTDVETMAISPDGGLLAIAYGILERDPAIYLYELSGGELIATLRGHRSPINCLAFSPDGQYLASGSFDGTTRLWNVPAHEPVSNIE